MVYFFLPQRGSTIWDIVLNQTLALPKHSFPKDPKLDGFFGILQSHWAWVDLSGAHHAAINAHLNNEEEVDDEDCMIVDGPSHFQPDEEPSTPALKAVFVRMNAARSSGDLMPPPTTVPRKVPLPPLPAQVLPNNPADLHPEDREKIQARLDAIRFPVSTGYLCSFFLGTMFPRFFGRKSKLVITLQCFWSKS